MRTTRVVVPLAAAAVLASAVPAEAAARRHTLKAFRTCSSLVDTARDAAQAPPIPFRGSLMGAGSDAISPRSPFPKPDPTGAPIGVPDVAVAVSGAVPPMPASADATTTSGVTESSSTNVQETGIDEPDLAKAVGGKLYVIAGSTLWALDATGPTPQPIGSLDLGAPGGTLLIEGTRALVLLPRKPLPQPIAFPDAVGEARRAVTASTSEIAEIDLSDPTAMRLLRSMEVPGDLVTARLTDGTARIVVNSAASLDGGAAGTSTTALPAEGVSARAARRLGTRSFVPRTVLHSGVTGRTYRRSLVRCPEVRHPEVPQGTNLLTVLTVDMRKGLFNIDRDAVLGSAQVVYASPTGLYVVATAAADARTPSDIPRRATSDVYRFDTSVREETTYAQSGAVPGFALNQYSLGESGGVLRIATTEDPLWLSEAEQEPSRSTVTTLRPNGSRLEQVGQLTGLGKTERITAARFIGDVGYLVTFRQVDPLYTLDLADPEQPKVAGELKITGYSAYLHPVGDDLVLGIGREATEQGRAVGAAISLFDVADPKTPKLLARKQLDDGSRSGVEFDPHAFLWWAPSKLAVVPSQAPGTPETRYRQLGSAIGVRVDRGSGISDVGTVVHGLAWDRPQIVRTVVVGNRVLTLSDLGVQASKLSDLTPEGALPWISG